MEKKLGDVEQHLTSLPNKEDEILYISQELEAASTKESKEVLEGKQSYIPEQEKNVIVAYKESARF